MTIKADKLIVKAKPVNYAINQLSIGINDEFGNPSLTDNFYNGLLVCRSRGGLPQLSTYDIFTTSYSNSTQLLTLTLSSALPVSRGILRGKNVFIYVPVDHTTNYDLGLTKVESVTYDANSNNTMVTSFKVRCTVDPGNLATIPGQYIRVAAALYGDEIIYAWNKTVNQPVPTARNVCGVTAAYHLFDTGNSAWLGENLPSEDVKTASLTGNVYVQGIESGYSVYGYVKNNLRTLPVGELDQPTNEPMTLLAQTYCVFTKDYGWYRNTDVNSPGDQYWEYRYDKRRSTLSQLIYHLPEFYMKDGAGNENSDLKSFLSLFAFYIDTFKTSIDLIYDMHLVNRGSHKLLGGLLRQLGIRLEDFNNDARLGQRLLDNVVRMYKLKGSKSGIELAAKLFTGFYATVESVPNQKNLFRNASSSTFADGNSITDVWTTEPRSGTNVMPGPVLKREGSPFRGLSYRSITYTNASNTLTTSTFRSAPQFFSAYSSTGTNIIANGVLALHIDGYNAVANTETVIAVAGPRKIVINGTHNIGATTVSASYADAFTGDFVIQNTSTNAISPGTYVSSVSFPNPGEATTASLVLSSPLKQPLYTGNVLYASTAGIDKISAFSSTIQVTDNNSYAYSFYAHRGGYSAANITPFIKWYDAAFTAVTATGPAVTATTNAWTRISMTANAPAGARYAVPGFSITRNCPIISSFDEDSPDRGFFFDAFQFEESATVSAYNDAVSPGDFTLKFYDVQNNIIDYENARYKRPLFYLMKDYFLRGCEPIRDPDLTYNPLDLMTVTSMTDMPGVSPIGGVYKITTTVDDPPQLSIGSTISAKGFYHSETNGSAWSDLTVTDSGLNHAIVVGKPSASEIFVINLEETPTEGVVIESITATVGTAVSNKWYVDVTDKSGILPGMGITGTGIPANTNVVAVSETLPRVFISSTTTAALADGGALNFTYTGPNTLNTNKNNNIIIDVTSSPSWASSYSYSMGYKTYSDTSLTYSGS